MEKRIRARRIEIVPPHTSSPEPAGHFAVTSQSSQRQPPGILSGGALIVFLVAMFVIFILPMCNRDSQSGKTDGVFESATRKLDKGLPLNEREQKRLDDILRYNGKK